MDSTELTMTPIHVYFTYMKRLFIPLLALILLAGCTGSPLEKNAKTAIKALQEKDMETLASLVHPVEGVRFTPYTYVDKGRNIFFYAMDIPEAMEDNTLHRWGEHDGTGLPIFLTFTDYYNEFVYDQDYAKAKEVTWNRKMEHGSLIDNAPDAYPESQVVEYYFPGFEDKYGGMDWVSLRLVWQEFDGNWYLVGIIHDQWSP